MDNENNLTIESSDYNNSNSTRSMLEYFNETETEPTSNISSYREINNNVEILKNGIQYGSIVQMKEFEIINILTTVISCKETSTIHENMYVDFMNFLEFYDKQYSDKFNDLLDHILENMSEEEKQNQYKDADGNPVLVSKPRLERNYNNTYMTCDIKNDNMYKLTMTIIKKMKNIRQYEEDYCINISSTSSRGI
tara:strand:- start:2881 stop:3462 length:582 start_codon:yes stop_codon:yes gene_type:complete